MNNIERIANQHIKGIPLNLNAWKPSTVVAPSGIAIPISAKSTPRRTISGSKETGCEFKNNEWIPKAAKRQTNTRTYMLICTHITLLCSFAPLIQLRSGY